MQEVVKGMMQKQFPHIIQCFESDKFFVNVWWLALHKEG